MDLLLSIATLIPDYAKSDPTDDPADQTSECGGSIRNFAPLRNQEKVGETGTLTNGCQS